MKKTVTILGLVLMTSTGFAADQECSRQLESMLYRSGEVSRLETESYRADRSDRHVEALMKIANDHREIVEKMKVEFKANCLK